MNRSAFWSAGGAGYPFGHNDRTGPDYSSLLAGLEPDVGGPISPGSVWCRSRWPGSSTYVVVARVDVDP